MDCVRANDGAHTIKKNADTTTAKNKLDFIVGYILQSFKTSSLSIFLLRISLQYQLRVMQYSCKSWCFGTSSKYQSKLSDAVHSCHWLNNL